MWHCATSLVNLYQETHSLYNSRPLISITLFVVIIYALYFQLKRNDNQEMLVNLQVSLVLVF